MSDEGEEVRYSDRDPARTRRGSDDRGRGKRPPIRERERERERDPKIFLFFYLFFLPSFKKLVGKSALLALLAKTSPLSPKKSSALFVGGLSFLSIN